jgi:hypothetical protein
MQLAALRRCLRILSFTAGSAGLCAACMLLNSPVLHAQANTGSLYGIVADAKGLAVSNAVVTVRSTDLSLARTTTSSSSNGRFGITGLVPGSYIVEARGNGLILRRPIRLTIGLGSSTQIAVRLDIPQVRQSTAVRAQGATSEGNTVAPPINQSEASISNFFAGTVVTYLPNRDRDLSQFDQLSANDHEDSEGTGVIVAGQRSTALITQVDGVDVNIPLFGGIHGQEDRSFFLPQTVIREFQVVSSGVAADIGQTSAGLINVATKEGSNKFHGEAFYTVRPSPLTSADAFGNSLSNFQSTYGGSFGGPIRKDRTFFYTGFEQDFLHAPFFSAFEPQFPNTIIPAPLTALQGQIVEHNTPIGFSARIDHSISPANTLNLELAFNRIRASNLGDGLTRSIATLANSSSLSGQGVWSKAGLTTLLTSRTVNQALVSWSTLHRNQTPNSTAPELFINGFGILGGDALGQHLFTSQQLQFTDGISISRGSSLIELGGAFSHDPAYEQREENLNARFDYDSLTDYLDHAPRRYQQTFLTDGPTRYDASVEQLSLYANARVELRPRLTLTAGLRWAGQWNPQPPHPNAAIPQTQRIPNDLNQWQPRLGLAWNPLPKTVLRLSGGLYAAPTPATIFHRVFTDNGLSTITADSYFDPRLLAVTGALTGTPQALTLTPIGLTTPSAVVVGIDPAFRNPDSLQTAASLDQTLSPKLTLRAGYLRGSTWHLQRRLDENLNPPTITSTGVPVFPPARPIAGVGRLLVNQSTAHSSYNALNVSAISQISRRSQFTINYTLSKTRDDDSNTGPYGIDPAVDPFNLRLEQGNSALDMRHILNASAIFNLPVGFKFNPLFLVHSAAPYTAIVGFDTQNDANDFNDRAIVNGTQTARNAFRQAAFTDTDLRIVKDFTLKGEGHHLDLFMDVFNVFGNQNRNFGADQVSFYGNASSPVFSAAQPLFAPGVTRIGGPREIQFTARFVAF